MKEKLKPCPFCGSENIEIERGPISGLFCVTCHSCFASSAFFDCEDAVIKAWNRRAEKSNRYDEGYIDGYVKAKLDIANRFEALRAAYFVQYYKILKEENK